MESTVNGESLDCIANSNEDDVDENVIECLKETLSDTTLTSTETTSGKNHEVLDEKSLKVSEDSGEDQLNVKHSSDKEDLLTNKSEENSVSDTVECHEVDESTTKNSIEIKVLDKSLSDIKSDDSIEEKEIVNSSINIASESIVSDCETKDKMFGSPTVEDNSCIKDENAQIISESHNPVMEVDEEEGSNDNKNIVNVKTGDSLINIMSEKDSKDASEPTVVSDISENDSNSSESKECTDISKVNVISDNFVSTYSKDENLHSDSKSTESTDELQVKVISDSSDCRDSKDSNSVESEVVTVKEPINTLDNSVSCDSKDIHSACTDESGDVINIDISTANSSTTEIEKERIPQEEVPVEKRKEFAKEIDVAKDLGLVKNHEVTDIIAEEEVPEEKKTEFAKEIDVAKDLGLVKNHEVTDIIAQDLCSEMSKAKQDHNNSDVIDIDISPASSTNTESEKEKISQNEVPIERRKEFAKENYATKELDLGKQHEISDTVAQDLSSKISKTQPDSDVQCLNLSPCSNKLDSSDQPKTSENSNKVEKESLSEGLKKRNPIYSDDDDGDESMSSIEKISCEDSESMDCEEISLDGTSNKKKDNDVTEVTDSKKKSQELDDSIKDFRKEDNSDLNTATASKKPKLDNSTSDNLPFAELSNEETGFPDMFNGLVKIGKYISVKGDFTLRSTEALVESPSLVASYLLKEPDKFPPKEKEFKSDKDFFHNSVGELLIGIGISRVNEWFHRDMVRIKKRQIKRDGKQPQLEEELGLHQKCYVAAKRANGIFSFPCKSCETCRFTTESSIVMEGHLLVPHITPRREYQCNFCSLINRDPREMLFHMESEHRKVGRIQPPVLFYECPFCMFESNSKVKLNSHLTKCQRVFDNGVNQAPPKEFDIPAQTPRPITVAMVKNYERSVSLSRGRGRIKKSNGIPDVGHQFSQSVAIASNHGLSGFQSNQSILSNNMTLAQNQMLPQGPMNSRPGQLNAMGQIRPAMPPLHLPSTNRFYQVVNSSGQVLPLLGSSHLVTSPSQFPFSSNLVNSGQKKMLSQNSALYSNLYGNGLRQQITGKNSDLSITPLPKLQGPYPVQFSKASTPLGNSSLQPSTLVVCEICDGYIKDLEQLRTHMQLIHKVKIHPKMLVSRPPLNCQKCQWRYFTDQGLERHLLGAHGLVTSNMQEMANKNKDAGCCTICGRVYASKLVTHMSQVHKITLKPAHLSYKCTVCSATFSLYRLFENHVYLVHSGAAKRPSDGSTSPAKKLFKSQENLDKSDLPQDHSKKHSENSPSNDLQVFKCKDCGIDTSVQLHDKSTKSEKCEKCLKSDGLLQDVNSCKELMKKDKECQKVSV